MTVEIIDGIKRTNGDLTYQAQLNVPKDGIGKVPSGRKAQTVCIRGPSRVERQGAEEDARALKDAFLEGGVQQVRKLRATLTGRAGSDISK